MMKVCSETTLSKKSYHIKKRHILKVVKSIDWFLYDTNFLVKGIVEHAIVQVFSKICLFSKSKVISIPSKYLTV